MSRPNSDKRADGFAIGRPEHRKGDGAVSLVNRIAQAALTNDVLRGSASALAIRFTAAVVGFVMFALCSRNMEPAAFGTLAVIFNAMSFLAAAALCGQETLIVRSWDEYVRTGRPGLARGALGFSARVAVAAAFAVAVLVALGWLAWDRNVPVALVVGASSFLFAQSLMHFSGQFSRVAGGLFIGELPRELAWRSLVVMVLLVHYLWHIAFGTTEFFFIAAGSLLLALLAQVWRVSRVIPSDVAAAEPVTEIRPWIARSFKMWLSALMDLTSQYLEVVVIGLVLGPTIAAFYFVASRITNVFAMIAGSITIYATSQISGLFHANAKGKLQDVLRSLAVISAITAVGAFAVVVLGGKVLLSMFGETYVSAYPALIVLSLGASVTALAGPTAYLLLLTGNEGAYPRIMACGLALRFILIVALGSAFGLIGAAIAWSAAAAALALALVVASRRLVGVDPSLTSAFTRPMAPAVPVPGSAP
jgi:O-antigen/teichoic acid export membrane protein